jgi:hypothetical protein
VGAMASDDPVKEPFLPDRSLRWLPAILFAIALATGVAAVVLHELQLTAIALINAGLGTWLLVALRGADDRLSAMNEDLRRHVAELEQRNREMTRLAELGDLLQSCETTGEVAMAVVRTVAPLFSGDAGALYELTPPRSAVEAVAVWGEPPPTRRVFSPTQCWALRRGRLHVVSDTDSELRCEHVEEPIGRGTLCAPLVAQGETLGVLHLQVRAPVSTKQRAALLADRERMTRTLAEQLELALANFRLRATLREQSARDVSE